MTIYLLDHVEKIAKFAYFLNVPQMYQVEAIANYFIKRGLLDGNPVNPMKLQKLLYYAQGYYMAYFNGNRLFNEQIQAWKYGPVIEKIYHDVKGYGNYPITSCIEGYVENKMVALNRFISNIDVIEFEPKNENDSNFLDATWKGLGSRDAITLSAATHEAGTPWDTVAKQYDYILPKGVIIDDILIKEYFSAKIKK